MQQIQTVLQHDGLNHLALADRQELSAEADRQRGLADEAKTSAERSAKHRFASLCIALDGSNLVWLQPFALATCWCLFVAAVRWPAAFH